MCRRQVTTVLALLLIFTFTGINIVNAADEIHWTITGSTSVTFDWRGTYTENIIYFGTSPDNLDNMVVASTPAPLPFSSQGPFWEARLVNLLPETIYYYSIGSSPIYAFHTPYLSSDFTVFAQGDIGAAKSYPEVAGVQSLIADARPDLVLMVGDLTYGHPNGQADVDSHFNDVMVWSREAAYMPTWGNHEWDAPEDDDLRNYKGRFDFPNPQTSPAATDLSSNNGGGKDWYWFDYSNVRFIIYPEPYRSSAWTDWSSKAKSLMDQAQQDPNIQFIVTAGHWPAYSSGYHPGSSTLKNILDSFGDTHSKYVLNVNGHSHNYERTHAQHGVVHITVGTGGAMGETVSGSCPWMGGCPPPAWSAFRAFHTGALKLNFTASGIEGSFICGPADKDDDVVCNQGTVLDQFVIVSSGSTDSSPPSVGSFYVIPNRRGGATVIFLD